MLRDIDNNDNNVSKNKSDNGDNGDNGYDNNNDAGLPPQSLHYQFCLHKVHLMRMSLSPSET
jgi:hypothetical protein